MLYHDAPPPLAPAEPKPPLLVDDLAEGELFVVVDFVDDFTAELALFSVRPAGMNGAILL